MKRVPDSDMLFQISGKGYTDAAYTPQGKNLYWTNDMNAELPIRIAPSGPGSLPAETLCKAFLDAAAYKPDNACIKIDRGGKIIEWTWTQYKHDIFAFAKAMKKIGITERKALNIMGVNAPEWAISFFGAIFYNCVVSGVYVTNGPEACKYQSEHSEAELIVCDGEENLKKYAEINLPSVKAYVVYSTEKLTTTEIGGKKVYKWDDFLKLGKETKDEVILKEHMET